MMRRGLVAHAVALVLLSATISAVPPASGAPAHPESGPSRVLLALGDSLAAGYQPTDGTVAPKPDPVTGFADAGYPGGYAEDVATHEGLQLVDLACPGETTASMRGKPAQTACATLYKDEFGASSQEAAAVDYIATHKGSIALLTIDIGANDLSHCAGSASQVNLSCVSAAEKSVVSNLPALLQPLEKAIHTDDPGSPMVAMTYYDPFLGLAVDPGGAGGSESAASSLLAVTALNTQLRVLYGRAGMLVADIAGAFSTNSALPLGTVNGKTVPHNVLQICHLTWMCPASSSKRAPDIHPTTAGYKVIAGSFEQRVPAKAT